MGILSEFERRLEGAIEGIFTKAFRTGLHPVELATRVLREMETGKMVGVREIWVPNHYVLMLSAEDRDRFVQAEQALRRELEQVVRDGAAERGWTFVGPPGVEFDTDPDLGLGEFGCHVSFVEGGAGWNRLTELGATPPPPPVATDGGRADRRAGAGRKGAELLLMEHGGPGRAFPLSKDRVLIGRLADSDVVLSDPGASRRHAEVRHEDGEFVIYDLGSTNGTIVNDTRVGEQRLREGDRITIGRTVLEFRRR